MKKIKTLKDLAVDHPYYANNGNYYSNDALGKFECWEDFYAEFGKADVDMNLVYRWDIKPAYDEDDNETGGYSMYVYIIGQRKGLYLPNIIESVVDKNVPEIIDYLKIHYKRMIENWEPIDFNITE